MFADVGDIYNNDACLSFFFLSVLWSWRRLNKSLVMLPASWLQIFVHTKFGLKRSSGFQGKQV